MVEDWESITFMGEYITVLTFTFSIYQSLEEIQHNPISSLVLDPSLRWFILSISHFYT